MTNKRKPSPLAGLALRIMSQRGWGLRQLALAMGVQPSTLSEFLSGNKGPGLAIVSGLLRVEPELLIDVAVVLTGQSADIFLMALAARSEYRKIIAQSEERMQAKRQEDIPV